VPGARWTIGGALARVRAVLGPALQASAGAGAAWYVAHDLLGHAQPFFAPIAAAVSLSTSHVQRARRSAQMVVGVLLGIGVSELLHPLLGNGALSIALVVLATLLLAVAVGVGFVGEGMMFFNQAAASAILVIALHRAGTGGERATDALVGGAVALVIGVGLFPADPLRLLARAERGVLAALLRALERHSPRAAAAQGLEADAADLDMPAGERDWALVVSHEVHRRLTALTQARGTARAAVRVAPRRMARRAQVEREEARVAHMYLLASAVLSLMRNILDVPRGAPRAQWAGEVEEVAGALRELIDAPRPWPPATVDSVRARMRRLTSAPAPGAAGESAIVTTAARRVAGDLLRLLPEDGCG
jgi:uncharacterized membrane protein YgaE (UPF0421/DUF939 family)